MVFTLALPFSALFRLWNPDRLCRVAAHLHKVEPLSTIEAHDAHEAHNAHEAHEAHNVPLTTPLIGTSLH